MNTTAIEMNRAILNFTGILPNHQDLLAGLPTSPEADLQLYIAAGPWPNSGPLPDDLGSNLATALTTAVLGDARRELAIGLAARMSFNRGRLAPSRIRDLCALPMRDLINRFHESESSLESSDVDVKAWIALQTAQLHFWETEYERLQARTLAKKPPSLCESRQLAAGFSLMSVGVLEFYWGDEDDPFEPFFDQVVAAFPDCDFRQRGVVTNWTRKTDVPPAAEPPSDDDTSLAA